MKRLEPILAISMALVAILGSIGSASAQDYPSRPITMIVPYPAGGLFDALARILAEPMRGALAQSVVIENVGGAGRLHGRHRLRRSVRRQCCDLPAPIRCGAGLRTGRAADQRPHPDRQQDRRPGEKSEGVDGMAEGKPCPGCAGS